MCDQTQTETQLRLFGKCKWISELREKLSTWLGIRLQDTAASQMIKWIKRKKWSQFQKERVVAAWGASCIILGKQGIG